MLEAAIVDQQLAVVPTPPSSSIIERMGADGASVWMLYDVENATSMYDVVVSVLVH